MEQCMDSCIKIRCIVAFGFDEQEIQEVIVEEHIHPIGACVEDEEWTSFGMVGKRKLLQVNHRTDHMHHLDTHMNAPHVIQRQHRRVS